MTHALPPSTTRSTTLAIVASRRFLAWRLKLPPECAAVAVVEVDSREIREGGSRVLYVDDEEMTRALFARELSRHGFSVTTAPGGLAGLRECETGSFDLVVSDLRMPGVDGLALLRELRAHHIEVPFVLLTGVPELDVLRAEHEVFDVLPKPWSAELLVRRCRDAIESARPEPRATSLLLVEDNPADAELFSLYLEESRHPYALTTVSTLETALEALRATAFELVVTDLKLPDAHGLSVVEKLRRDAPDAAILIASGNDDELLATRAIALGAQDFFVKGHMRDVTLQRALLFALERKRTERRLAHLAHYDELTGLANRKRLRVRMVEAISRANRSGERFGVVYIDLDGFKPINDRCGHEAGDHVLRTMAARMRQAVRDYDTVSRLGGDEFAVLLEPPCDFDGANASMERLLARLRAPIGSRDGELAVGASFGLAMFPEDGRAPEDLLRVADENMYRAKKAGGARYSSSVPSRPGESLPTRLGRAAAEGELHLAFQPQITTASGEIAGAEALLRWSPADGEALSPAEFVPVLEQTGLIVEVGAKVIRDAVRQLHRWDADGHPGLEISVNVSSRQFEAGELPSVVESALAQHAIAPERLHLEITESTLMRNTRATNTALQALKEIGVKLAIDDFGTGYSSLAYLHRFRVDSLKIDRAFVQELGRSPEVEAVTGAIIALGKQLGLFLVAEGIENRAQLEFVTRRGCERVQGFHFSRAVAAEQFIELLAWQNVLRSGEAV